MRPSLKLLFVDDEETFSRSTGDLLRREGFECDCAVEVSEACRYLEDNAYDLVIADINMPGNLELEFVKRLAHHHGGIPTILVTGHPSMQSAIESVELPVVAYLIKPFEFSQLREKVLATAHRVTVLRAVRDELDRLKAYRRSLLRAQAHMEEWTTTGNDPSFQAFVGTAMRNIIDGLATLRTVVEKAPGSDVDTELRNWPLPHSTTVREVLHETVATLERSKSAFKSKELGELRRKLEDLLRN